MLKIALLGSTGSIGRQVLKVVDRYKDKFKIVSLSAGSNYKLLEEQINKYKPKVATLCDSEKAIYIKEIPKETTFYYGEDAVLHSVYEDCDVVFGAMMGFSGVKAIKEAITLKKTVALANKETLVSAGELIIPLAKKNNVNIIPVDSEHSAIWQCLNYNKDREFKNLIITASGGAFRDKSIEELENVTSVDALKHPNWQMGAKITIDCATMVNKGFEILEAMWLFNCGLDRIKVLIHKESIVHSMVEFNDGGVLAQLGMPSMELPIQLALTYPERLEIENNFLSLAGKSLSFLEVDENKYPCFSLVKQAIKMGYNYPCAISSADEVAVKNFLEGKIKYTQISSVLSYVLEKIEKLNVTFENIEYTDKIARSIANEYILKWR